jgi:hypothetical protein
MSNQVRVDRRPWALLALFVVTLGSPARAGLYNPLDYPSQGVLKPSVSGIYTIGTYPGGLTLSDGLTTYYGVGGVFDFDSVQLGKGDTIGYALDVIRPATGIVLLSRGDAAVGSISADYMGYTASNPGPGVGQPGQQGFGDRFFHYSGSGGGGYGTPGAQGYTVDLILPSGNHRYIPGGAGGPAYGNQTDTVTWGSAGANGLSGGLGGSGGGSMVITALGQVSIYGLLSANGLSGTGSGEGSAGGGSGGGILVAGQGVSLYGGITALGGGSGPGRGGGGRVSIWTGDGGFSGSPSAIQAGVVTFSVVPEPAAGALMAIGLLTALCAAGLLKRPDAGTP